LVPDGWKAEGADSGGNERGGELAGGTLVSWTVGQLDSWTVGRKIYNGQFPVYKGVYDYLSGKHQTPIIKFCGSGHYQIRGRPVPLQTLAKRLKGSKHYPGCLRYGFLTIFPFFH